MNKFNPGDKRSPYITEKLFLKAYESARTLKEEIRKKIRRRNESNWNFCGMRSQGSFIFLCFQKREEDETNLDDSCGCLQCG